MPTRRDAAGVNAIPSRMIGMILFAFVIRLGHSSKTFFLQKSIVPKTEN